MINQDLSQNRKFVLKEVDEGKDGQVDNYDMIKDNCED